MHRIIINELGPVKHAEVEIEDYLILTGAQASGKSTIAKSIYYFRTIKEDLLLLIQRKYSNSVFDNSEYPKTLFTALKTALREKFLSVFGSSWSMSKSMTLEYYFTDSTFVKIFLEDDYYNKPNHIGVNISKDIIDFTKVQDRHIKNSNAVIIDEEEREAVRKKLSEVFNDPYEVVYIPAGRSMITLLASQLSYFYISLENSQRKSIDFCTRNYIERIMKISPEFERGIFGLNEGVFGDRSKGKLLTLAQELIGKILNGTYRYSKGEERLYLNENRYVKINFASSGQQEVVWILNLLYYAMVNNSRTYFIIEEPESHLFPQAQKEVMDLVALAANNDNCILVTSHSPYVLGAVNNQLFASRFETEKTSEASSILNKVFWISPQKFDCLFVEKGEASNCIDQELNMIDNSVIDGISSVINEQFDKLSDLEFATEGKGN